MNVIQPTTTDIAEMGGPIADLIASYVSECGALAVNPAHIFAMLFQATQNKDLYLSFLMDKEKLVGYFLGAFHKELFTGARTGNQYGFFVLKSHRHGVHKLIKDFEEYAESVGCRKVYLHVGSYSPVDRWSRVLKRSGFRAAETAFVKEF